MFTVSNITNGTITQSGPGNAIVRFTPPLETSGRAGFNFTVTDSTGDTWTQQCCLLISTKTQPRPITWVGDGITNNWDTTTTNFSSLVGPTAFANDDAVTINDSGSNSPTIKVVGALAPASLTVSNYLEKLHHSRHRLPRRHRKLHQIRIGHAHHLEHRAEQLHRRRHRRRHRFPHHPQRTRLRADHVHRRNPRILGGSSQSHRREWHGGAEPIQKL